MKKIVILLIGMVSGTVLAQNQAKKTFTFSLQQAIDYGIQNNYSALNANRDIAIATQKKWETTANGLPQISGNVGYQNNIKLQKSLIPAEIFGGPVGSFAEVAFGTKQNMGVGVTLSQLLFDGSYIVALQASKVYLEYYQNAKQKSNSEIREMVVNSYGSVLLAEASSKILANNVVILEKNYNDINQIYKNGLGEQESVEQISITLATVKSNLNNVNRIKAIALKMLKINLGITITDELVLSDNLEGLSVSQLPALNATEKFEVNQTIDYQMVSSLVKQKQLLLKLEKSKALPSLGAVFNAGASSFGQEFNFLSGSQKWYNYANVGVSLHIPLFSSLGRAAKTQQAKISLDQANTQAVETEQKLKLAFEKSKSDFDFSIEEYATAKSNLNLAERIEKKQQIKFKEGLSTSFEFSEAQRQLYAAQQNFLQSMVDVINKKATLEKIIYKN